MEKPAVVVDNVSMKFNLSKEKGRQPEGLRD